MVENVIYPAYLDASLSHSEGRRVAQFAAVEVPVVDETAKTVQQVGYDAVIGRDKRHSREFETRGRVPVNNADDTTKSSIVQAVAAYVGILRD